MEEETNSNAGRTWNDEKVTRLIELVRESPLLYNSLEDEYHDRNKKHAEFVRIDCVLNMKSKFYLTLIFTIMHKKHNEPPNRQSKAAITESVLKRHFC